MRLLIFFFRDSVFFYFCCHCCCFLWWMCAPIVPFYFLFAFRINKTNSRHYMNKGISCSTSNLNLYPSETCKKIGKISSNSATESSKCSGSHLLLISPSRSSSHLLFISLSLSLLKCALSFRFGKWKYNFSKGNGRTKKKPANYAKIRTGCVFIRSFFTHRINHNYVLSHSFNSICVYFSYNSFILSFVRSFARSFVRCVDVIRFTSDWNKHTIAMRTIFSQRFICLYSLFGCFCIHRPEYVCDFFVHSFYHEISLALHKILRMFYVQHLTRVFHSLRRSIHPFFSLLFSAFYYFKWNFVMCSTDEIINANVIIANRRDV